MKIIKWKILLITCAVCLFPILFGILAWDALPEQMAIHFNIENQPDGFASKPFAVFGIPWLMVLLQIFCCAVNDINAAKHGTRVKFERATKWIIPCMTVILQALTIGIALRMPIDVRRVVSVLVGAVLLTVGNYLPKFDYIKNYDLSAEKARKINRFIGFETVVLGVLFILSIFLPPVYAVACIFLLIPYAAIGIWYGVKEGRK